MTASQDGGPVTVIEPLRRLSTERANWGRIICAVGYPADINPDTVDILPGRWPQRERMPFDEERARKTGSEVVKIRLF